MSSAYESRNGDHADRVCLGLLMPLIILCAPVLLAAWCLGLVGEKIGLGLAARRSHPGDTLPRIDVRYPPPRTKPPAPPPPPNRDTTEGRVPV